MDRISTATKAVDLFGAGKHGFKDGNLALGISPTDLNAAWFNLVQEEILNVIESSGAEANPALRNQLYTAVQALITASLTKSVPVRQTVLSGPVDAAGLPAFGGATGGTVVTMAGTLVATAANGASGAGTVDRVGSIVNASWTGLNTNGQMYLYLDIDAAGNCTPGATSLAPVYQWGGAYSTVGGQFTFNIQEMLGKVGSGAAAAQTYRVFVGEVTVAGAVVTAITWYALMGRFRSAFTAGFVGVNASVSYNHNIGVSQVRRPILSLRCNTADSGYVAGDQLSEIGSTGSSTQCVLSFSWTSKTVQFSTGASSALFVIPKGGGTPTTLTNTSWDYSMSIERGW